MNSPENDPLAFAAAIAPHVQGQLRIAVVTETYPPEINGVAVTLRYLVEGLLRSGHAVQLVRPCQHRNDLPANAAAFNEILVPGMRIPRYDSLQLGFPSARLLEKRWKSQRPDVVHVATEGPLGWSALSAARTLGIACSSDFHTNFHRYSQHYGAGWLKRPIAAYLRTFHNRARYTFVPTSELRDELEGIGLRNVRVIERGVDTVLFNPRRRSHALREQWGVGSSDTVAVHVGRLAAEKNLPLLIKAYHAMKVVRQGLRLVVVGDGPQRARLQRQHPDVVFAGMQTGISLAEHYASGDVFLYPSVTETFGNVTLEAMASGLAVVAFNYAAARMHMRHGHDGLLARFGDAQQFIDFAADLADAPPRIRRMGGNARETVADIDWDVMHARFESALRALTQAGGEN